MTENESLVLYAIKSKDGKYLRSKGYGGYGNHWVEKLSQAKTWNRIGPAKAQITWWAKNYPEYGIPDLLELTVSDIKVIDQQERVEKVKKDHKKRKEMRDIRQRQEEINRHYEEIRIAQKRLDKLVHSKED